MVSKNLLLAIAAICLQAGLYNAAKVSDTACTDTDGNDQCATLENAECDNTGENAKCRCSNGFKEVVSGTDSTCERDKVSNVECTKDQEGQCTLTANAECDNSETNAKCKCSDGYRENPDDDSTCIKTIGSPCSGTDACPGVADSVCDDTKCTCKADTEEKNNDCITTVSGTPCSAAEGGCENIDNSVCNAEDGKCTCSLGFTMKVDECVGNSASTFKTGGWLAFVLFCIFKLIN